MPAEEEKNDISPQEPGPTQQSFGLHILDELDKIKEQYKEISTEYESSQHDQSKETLDASINEAVIKDLNYDDQLPETASFDEIYADIQTTLNKINEELDFPNESQGEDIIQYDLLMEKIKELIVKKESLFNIVDSLDKKNKLKSSEDALFLSLLYKEMHTQTTDIEKELFQIQNTILKIQQSKLMKIRYQIDQETAEQSIKKTDVHLASLAAIDETLHNLYPLDEMMAKCQNPEQEKSDESGQPEQKLEDLEPLTIDKLLTLKKEIQDIIADRNEFDDEEIELLFSEDMDSELEQENNTPSIQSEDPIVPSTNEQNFNEEPAATSATLLNTEITTIPAISSNLALPSASTTTLHSNESTLTSHVETPQIQSSASPKPSTEEKQLPTTALGNPPDTQAELRSIQKDLETLTSAPDPATSLETNKLKRQRTPFSLFNHDLKPEQEPGKPALALEELKELAVHYQKMCHLALYSTHEFPQMEKYSFTYQLLKTDLLKNLAYTDSPHYKKFLADGKHFEDHPQSPPTEIINFSEYCTIVDTSIIEDTVTKLLDDKSTPEMKSTTSPHPLPRDKARITHLALDSANTQKAVGVERYRENGQFISESHLPPKIEDPDALMPWACTTITRFLASAPEGTESITFEDGYQPAQLAALISYCDFMGYSFSVGAIQGLRMHAEGLHISKHISDDEYNNLREYYPITLTDTLSGLVEVSQSQDYWKGWAALYGNSSYHPKKWQTWLNLPQTKEKYPQVPPLGVERHDALFSAYQKNSRSTLRIAIDKGKDKDKSPVVLLDEDDVRDSSSITNLSSTFFNSKTPDNPEPDTPIRLSPPTASPRDSDH